MLAIEKFIGIPRSGSYVADATTEIDLERQFVYEQIKFRLAFTATLASFTTPPNKFVEAVENLVQLISINATRQVVGGVNDTVKAVDLAYLRFLSHLVEGTDMDRSDVGTSNTAYNAWTTANIYFKDPRSDNPRLTMLDSRLLSGLKFDVLFRDPTALYSGGVGGTTTLSNVAFTLLGVVFAGGKKYARPYIKETQQLFDVTQSQVDKEYIGMKIGNQVRRYTFKGTVGANTFADPNDTPLNGNASKTEGPHTRVRVNGIYDRVDYTWAQIRALDKEMFSVESVPTGYALAEMARNGKISESLNLVGAQSASLVADIQFTGSNTNEIQVTTAELVQPKLS